MTALVTRRFHKLSDSLVELKVKVREAMATELATAVGTAVRDIAIVAMIDRFVNPTPRAVATPPHSGEWRHDGYDRWGEPKAPWVDTDEYDRPSPHTRCGLDEREAEPPPTLPTTAALAVGVHVRRWWLARNGTLPTAIGVSILVTALGFAGGPFAHAAFAVLAAATDLLTADSALARPDLS